jgi:glycine/D-amino acid oxidase-like deaminating enzyme
VKVAVVGGGVAGSLLAWRLSGAAQVDVFTGEPSTADASGASGGLVRGFDIGSDSCRLAAESLAEVLDSAQLRDWTGYQEIGAVYVLPEDVDPSDSLRTVEKFLPGSTSVVASRWFGGDLAVVERHAGYISPDRLRRRALEWLTANGTGVRADRVAEVADGSVRLADDTEHAYDVVVVAAGAWTSRLVAHPLRTKQIQYGIYSATAPGLGAFVDDRTGLYGRPHGDGTFLLGLGCDRWDVDPDRVEPDLDLAERVVEVARQRLGVEVGQREVVASFDCYHDPSGLELRPVGSSTSLFTFTGGSGGAAKTVLTASRVAARTLVEQGGHR